MSSSPSVERVLTLCQKVLSGEPAEEAALREAVAGLQGDERALAERLAEVALEQGSWRRHLVQAAKLAEVGMSMAELVHELRQPLSGIAGFAQLLCGEPHSKDAAGWSREILNQTGRMEQLLERMRRFVRYSDVPECGPMDAAAAIRQAVALFPRMPPGVRLEVELASELPKVRAEAGPLVQVLTNLIGNAREATEPEPGVVLVRAGPGDDGGVEILVCDQGRGIEPEFAARLFSPFATTKGEAGTGLGLYICREILKSWGGEIRLAAAPPSFRTAFAVRLAPAEPVAARVVAESAEEKAERSFRQLVGELTLQLEKLPNEKRALVVDDEPALRRMFKVLLSAEPDLEVLEAPDGAEALTLLKCTPVQVLLADKNLPGMSGLELVRKVAERGLPLEALVVTGFPTAASVVEAIDARSADYLLKPLGQLERLRSRVRDGLEKARWRQLSAALGGDLRIWAEKLQKVVTTAIERQNPALLPALAVLAARPEGPGRLLLAGGAALTGHLTQAGHPAEGPLSAEQAAKRLESEKFDALLLGPELTAAEAVALARHARATSPSLQILWGLPLGDFDQALEALRAGVSGVLEQPFEPAALAKRLARATRIAREEARVAALVSVLDQLGLKQGALAVRKAA